MRHLGGVRMHEDVREWQAPFTNTVQGAEDRVQSH